MNVLKTSLRCRYKMVLYDICKDFVMTEKIEKSVRNFVPHESDKEFKRRYQAASPEERKGWGYDLVDTDDPEGDVAYCTQANEWLRDGQPVD